MDVHARVSILKHQDLVTDRSKTVRYDREIPYRNTRALSPVKQPGPPGRGSWLDPNTIPSTLPKRSMR